MIQRRLCLGVYLAMLVVEAAFTSLASSALAQNLAGQITHLEGTADVRLPGAAPTSATPNMSIEYHDQLTTHAKSQVEITLPRQTKLVTWPTSIVLFDRTVLGSLVKLLRGSLEASVLPPNPARFLTGNGEILVRGTLFDISYSEGVVRPGYEGCDQYTDLIVHEGVVAISNLANPSVVVEVPAGYETTIPCKLPPLSPGPIGITGAPAPGNAAASRTSAAAAITGSAAPPPGVGPSFPLRVVDP
jgi:hypothetical protein